VLVDTGSSDGSPAIARAAGARVFEHPWRADFAAARNLGLDRARGRWILYIDADERLRPVERLELQRLLSVRDVVAFRTWLRPSVRATPYREFRLWRNDPRIRFRRVIHEKVHDAIVAVARADGLRIADCDLALDHVGYDGDQTAKHRRNLPLLQAQLRAEPTDIYDWHHLGQVHLALGDEAAAERAFEHAVALARRRSPPDDHGRLAYADLLRLRQERGEDVQGLATEALDCYPQDWMLVWIRAAEAVRTGQPRAALAWLDELVSVDVRALPDTVAYDERIFGSAAHAARGLCLFRLGRYAEATAAYRAAERLEPDELELRVKRRLAEVRAGVADHASG
jgi:tetratricopeptide (TPR) repeat protein